MLKKIQLKKLIIEKKIKEILLSVVIPNKATYPKYDSLRTKLIKLIVQTKVDKNVFLTRHEKCNINSDHKIVRKIFSYIVQVS